LKLRSLKKRTRKDNLRLVLKVRMEMLHEDPDDEEPPRERKAMRKVRTEMKKKEVKMKTRERVDHADPDDAVDPHKRENQQQIGKSPRPLFLLPIFLSASMMMDFQRLLRILG